MYGVLTGDCVSAVQGVKQLDALIPFYGRLDGEDGYMYAALPKSF